MDRECFPKLEIFIEKRKIEEYFPEYTLFLSEFQGFFPFSDLA